MPSTLTRKAVQARLHRLRLLIAVFTVIWQGITLADAEAGEFIEGRLEHAGRERSYLLFVPSHYQDRPAALVLAFHGGGGCASCMAETSQLHQLAEQEGFLLVYPNGTGGFLGRGLSWNAGGTPPVGSAEIDQVDDIGFIRDLLDQLSDRYTIDPRRVFAAGMSKGGMFGYRVACELAERIAAVAAVAATMTTPHCMPSQPVSLLHIHGSRDEHVPLLGGKGVYTAKKADYPPVLTGIEAWRDHNGCSTQKEQLALSNDTHCYSYTGCQAGSAVRFCLVEGGGHAWPGSEPKGWQRRRGVTVTQSFSASEEIWDFFKDHPRPTP